MAVEWECDICWLDRARIDRTAILLIYTDSTDGLRVQERYIEWSWCIKTQIEIRLGRYDVENTGMIRYGYQGYRLDWNARYIDS